MVFRCLKTVFLPKEGDASRHGWSVSDLGEQFLETLLGQCTSLHQGEKENKHNNILWRRRRSEPLGTGRLQGNTLVYRCSRTTASLSHRCLAAGYLHPCGQTSQAGSHHSLKHTVFSDSFLFKEGASNLLPADAREPRCVRMLRQQPPELSLSSIVPLAPS